jgi:NOL1/NOP2/fmu family ribosome biogenesis protein
VVESHSSKHAAYGYRFYPDKIMGEGFFCGVLQKNDSSNVSYMSEHTSNVKTLNTRTKLASWIKPEGALIFEEDEVIYAVRENHLSLRGLLKSHLRLRKSGVKVGAVMKKGLVPDHELALSELLSSEVKRLVLNKIDAISYLRKEDIAVQDCHEGLHLVSYLGCGIGWAKVLSGRIKNNYPMSWRIMMRNDHK